MVVGLACLVLPTHNMQKKIEHHTDCAQFRPPRSQLFSHLLRQGDVAPVVDQVERRPPQRKLLRITVC